MTDANPILQSLLGSLTTIDQRLSFIESALRIPPAPQTRPKLLSFGAGAGVGLGLGPDHSSSSSSADQAAGRRLLPTPASWLSSLASFSSSSLSSASSSISSSSSTASPPSSSTPQLQGGQPLLLTSPNNRLKRPSRSWLQHRRVPKHGGNSGSGSGSGSGEEAASQKVPAREGKETQQGRVDDRMCSEDGGLGDKDGVRGEGGFLGSVGGSDRVVGGGSSGSAGGIAALCREPRPKGPGHSRLEALPEGFLITGRATLQEELDGWTIPRGYSMRINGTRSHGRRQKIRMVCFRGGRSRLRPKDEDKAAVPSRAVTTIATMTAVTVGGQEEEREHEIEPDHSQMPTPLAPRRRQRKPTTDRISKKCECPFRFELVEVGPGADRYAVHYTNDDHRRHNHAAADLMLDPRARKLPAALKDEVDQWLRGPSAGSGSGCSNGSGGAGASPGPGVGPGPGPGPARDAVGGGGGNGPWTIAKIQAELQRRGYGHVLDFDLRNRKRALLHKERMSQLKTEGGSGSDSSPTAEASAVGRAAEKSLAK